MKYVWLNCEQPRLTVIYKYHYRPRFTLCISFRMKAIHYESAPLGLLWKCRSTSSSVNNVLICINLEIFSNSVTHFHISSSECDQNINILVISSFTHTIGVMATDQHISLRRFSKFENSTHSHDLENYSSRIAINAVDAYNIEVFEWKSLLEHTCCPGLVRSDQIDKEFPSQVFRSLDTPVELVQCVKQNKDHYSSWMKFFGGLLFFMSGGTGKRHRSENTRQPRERPS